MSWWDWARRQFFSDVSGDGDGDGDGDGRGSGGRWWDEEAWRRLLRAPEQASPSDEGAGAPTAAEALRASVGTVGGGPDEAAAVEEPDDAFIVTILQEVAGHLWEIRRALRGIALPHRRAMAARDLRQSLHTLKGLLGAIGANAARQTVHRWELSLGKVERGEPPPFDQPEIDQLADVIAAQFGVSSALLVVPPRLVGGPGRALREISALLSARAAAAAASEHKRVEFLFSDDGVIVDRRVCSLIEEILVHIVTNAIVHGIESPQERRRVGKPEAGGLLIRTQLSPETLALEITDDGAGIDIRALARRAGVEARGLRGDALVAILCQPSVSTRSDQVSIDAGLGIGLDVVRRRVEVLGGAIGVETARGKGTTFHIALPRSQCVVTIEGASEGEGTTASEGETASKTASEGATASKTASEGATASKTASEGATASKTASEGATASKTASEGATASKTASEGATASKTASKTASEGETASKTASEGTNPHPDGDDARGAGEGNGDTGTTRAPRATKRAKDGGHRRGTRGRATG